jgi:hypothetical protein
MTADQPLRKRDEELFRLVALLPPPNQGHRDCVSCTQVQQVIAGQLDYGQVLRLRDQAWRTLGSRA